MPLQTGGAGVNSKIHVRPYLCFDRFWEFHCIHLHGRGAAGELAKFEDVRGPLKSGLGGRPLHGFMANGRIFSHNLDSRQHFGSETIVCAYFFLYQTQLNLYVFYYQ